MAKKHHKKKGKHRRRVGAAHLNASSPLVMIGSVAAGYFADQFIGINALIDGMLPGTITTAAVPASGSTPAIPATVTPTKTMNNVVMAGQIGLGGYLLLSKKKSMVKTIAGGVAVGLGARRLLKEMKVITGYQDIPVLGSRGVRGYQDTPVIGNSGFPNALSGGYPNALSGYRVNGGMGAYTPNGSGMRVMGSTGGTPAYSGGSGYRG